LDTRLGALGVGDGVGGGAVVPTGGGTTTAGDDVGAAGVEGVGDGVVVRATGEGEVMITPFPPTGWFGPDAVAE